MSAAAFLARTEPWTEGSVRPSPPEPAPPELSLAGFLEARARHDPNGLAFQDQPDRELWSGRPRLEWNAGFASDVVSRLAAFFHGLPLRPRAAIGIALPNGAEACLSILAVERAGYRACLLPLAWSERELAQALEVARIEVVVTQGQLGEERPAQSFARLAAGYFGVRFLCSFGPVIPDGVIDLDAVILGEDFSSPPSRAPAAGDSGVVTFERRTDTPRPIIRSSAALVAAGAAFLAATTIRRGDRIVSLLPPDDHRGLTTGLVAALLAGASLECHGLFDSAALVACLLESIPSHVVAPAWMEPELAASGLESLCQSIVLLHEAPARFQVRPGLLGPVVDALGIDEWALIAAPRREGRFSLMLDDRDDPVSGRLLRCRLDQDGRVLLGGPAAAAQELDRHGAPIDVPEWRKTIYRAETLAGIVTRISCVSDASSLG